MKRKLGLLLALLPAAILILCGTQPARAEYADLPDSALGDEVRKAIAYGLMNGVSDTSFGYSEPMTRAQFVTVLDRMLFSDTDSAPSLDRMRLSGADADGVPLPDTLELPDGLSEIHRKALSRAVAREVVEPSVPFRPNAPVTRGDMAELLVRALGLNDAALSLSSNRVFKADSEQISAPAAENPTPFLDLSAGAEGYAVIAYTIGMTKGLSETSFGPDATATRAQAAAMLTRVYERLQRETDFRHLFYTAAYPAFRPPADVVSVEWSRMTWANSSAVLSTKAGVSEERFLPPDYEKIVDDVTADGAKLYLSVFMDASGGVEKLLASQDGREEAVAQILAELTVPYSALGRNPYDGVTVDFQGLHREQQSLFTQFLSELRDALSPTGKGLYVCVAPYLPAGHWDDGYDYRAISEIADKVILTAFDYDADNLNHFLATEAYQNEAPAPLSAVYLSLWKLSAAVPDSSRLALGVSLRPVAWEIGQNNGLLSGSPVSPDADALRQYLQLPGTEKGWSVQYQMPYAAYTTRQGSRYFAWYENERSILEKTGIARLLGVTGISCSRADANPLCAPW